ncbi:hypothetical protein ACOSP7_018287 [Xanthoceras sorbifolium]
MGFYGHPEAVQRIHSWNLLCHLSGMYQFPWICGGDVNEMVSNSEKLGGNARMQGLMDDCRATLDDCGLMDIGFDGSGYTWSNKSSDGELVMERLDRFVCNEEWHLLFPFFKVDHFDFWQSDHCPIVVEFAISSRVIRNEDRQHRNIFHFEQCWGSLKCGIPRRIKNSILTYLGSGSN